MKAIYGTVRLFYNFICEAKSKLLYLCYSMEYEI